MLPAVKVMAVFTQAAAPHAAAARIVCRLTFLDGWPLPRHTHTHTQAVHKVREAPAAKVCPPPPSLPGIPVNDFTQPQTSAVH